MTSRLDEFSQYRKKMNDRIAGIDHLGIKRFYNLEFVRLQRCRFGWENQGIAGVDRFDGAALQRLHRLSYFAVRRSRLD